MKNQWKKLRVVVEIPVYGDLTETQFRWCVESALTSSRTLDDTLRNRGYWKDLRLGKLMVKMWSRVLARIPLKTVEVVREQRESYMG